MQSKDPSRRPLLMRVRQHLSEEQQQYVVDFPLHAACSVGCVREVGMHLQRVQGVDSYGNFPLYWAVKHKDPEIVEMLLGAGAEVDKSGESKTCSPLHLALKLGANSVVRVLLEFGANADAVDKQGYAPLHYAVTMTQIDSLHLLLRHGANPNVPSVGSLDTPLHFACGAGSDGTDSVQNANCDRNDSSVQTGEASDKTDSTPSSTTAFGSQWGSRVRSTQLRLQAPAIIQALVADARTDCLARRGDGSTALHLAVMGGDLEATQSLILAVLEKENKKPNSATAPPTSPLHSLLEAREPITSRTPLHVACAQNRTEMVALLTSFGADIDAEDMHRNTPLHIAARVENAEMLHVLLDAGADWRKRDHEGASPIHVAVSEAKDVGVVHTFLIYGVDPNIKETESGMTPIHLAVEQGNFDAMEALLQGGADVNLLTAEQRNTLHLVVLGCHKEICKRFVTDRVHRYSVCTSGFHPNVAALLLAYDAYVDHQDAQGFTPLHLACRYGLVDMAQVLLNAGANLTLHDGMGYDAFMSCRLVSSEDRRALFNLIFRAGYVPTPERRERMKGSALAYLIRHFDEHNIRLLVQCGYSISADKTWRIELNASIHYAENPPVPGPNDDEGETVRVTTADELEALFRIREFLDSVSTCPHSLWLLSRAAIRSHIKNVLQATDGNHGERETIWTRIDDLPVPEPIRAWLKLDPTRYEDPE